MVARGRAPRGHGARRAGDRAGGRRTASGRSPCARVAEPRGPGPGPRHRHHQVAPHPRRRPGARAGRRAGRPPCSRCRTAWRTSGGWPRCSAPSACWGRSPSWACAWRSPASSTTRPRAGSRWATRPALSERATRIHGLLAPCWDVALSERIVHDQWHKLLWNAGFNAICAVTGATAGEALATPELGGPGAGRDVGGRGRRPRATA